MSKPPNLVQGTLDLLILKILDLEPRSGWAIGQRLKQVSNEALQVSDGSLYPAPCVWRWAPSLATWWMVVRGAICLAGAGVLTGLVASLLVSRSLNSLLVDVAPFDAATLAGVSVLLFLVAAGAAYVPARRAACVDPLAALRMD